MEEFRMWDGTWGYSHPHTLQGWDILPQSTGNTVKREWDGEGWATDIGVMSQKGMIILCRWSRQELGALIDSGAVHAALHWTNENSVHTINLDSLVDHKNHCWMHDRVFVCNCSIYGTGIGMTKSLCWNHRHWQSVHGHEGLVNLKLLHRCLHVSQVQLRSFYSYSDYKWTWLFGLGQLQHNHRI